MVLSKTATITWGFAKLTLRQKRAILVTWMPRVAVVASFYFAVVADQVSLFFVGLALFLGAVIYGNR